VGVAHRDWIPDWRTAGPAVVDRIGSGATTEGVPIGASFPGTYGSGPDRPFHLSSPTPDPLAERGSVLGQQLTDPGNDLAAVEFDAP